MPLVEDPPGSGEYVEVPTVVPDPTPTSFATPEQLEARGISSTTHPGFDLEAELAAATTAIRNACGWHIAPVETLTFKRVSRVPSLVFLPASEITGLTAVKVDGVDVELERVMVDPSTGETNVWAGVTEISYTAGYASVPADLMVLTCEMVAAALNAAGGYAREQAGAVSVTYKTFAEAELGNRLAAYKLGYVP